MLSWSSGFWSTAVLFIYSLVCCVQGMPAKREWEIISGPQEYMVVRGVIPAPKTFKTNFKGIPSHLDDLAWKYFNEVRHNWRAKNPGKVFDKYAIACYYVHEKQKIYIASVPRDSTKTEIIQKYPEFDTKGDKSKMEMHAEQHAFTVSLDAGDARPSKGGNLLRYMAAYAKGEITHRGPCPGDANCQGWVNRNRIRANNGDTPWPANDDAFVKPEQSGEASSSTTKQSDESSSQSKQSTSGSSSKGKGPLHHRSLLLDELMDAIVEIRERQIIARRTARYARLMRRMYREGALSPYLELYSN